MKKKEEPQEILRNTELENTIEQIVRMKVEEANVIIDVRPTFADRYRVNVKKVLEGDCIAQEYRIIHSFYFIGTKLID